jgi:hypothetical protein
MYHEKMVLAIKTSGKVLREFKDEVRLPFGTEYSLLIKNLHARRAMANVQIDGVTVTEDVRLIIPANGEVELERFIKGGNLEQGNRFKFIERSERVEQVRGVGAEDGLIRLEFEFEREQVFPYWPPGTVTCNDWYSGTGSANATGSPPPLWNSTYTTSSTGKRYSKSSARGVDAAAEVPLKSSNRAEVNTSGITVPGSVSNQHFNWSSGFVTDGVKHVIVLKLIGEVRGQEVAAPVTVRTRQKCVTCGHVNKATAKFCSECGTGLVLV